MPHGNKIQQDSLNDVWITAGIFSNHYLLERVPQVGSKIWPLDEEVLQIYKAVRELYERTLLV